MTFQEQLNFFMEEIPCTGKELAQNSGISEAVISRYRKGDRIPSANSEFLKKLAEGIALTAREKGIEEWSSGNIFQSLSVTLKKEEGENFLYQKFDMLIKILDINVARMAASLHYDASHISKIRTGKRKPSNPLEFSENVCSYIVQKYSSEEQKREIASLIGCEIEKLGQRESFIETLREWMCSFGFERPDYVSGFLRKMDEFNLDEYIRAIHFESFKIPKAPFQRSFSRHYYGLKEIREGELDFLKYTVLAKSMEPVYLCSDMPVEDMAEDTDFAKKYMFGLAMILKKGLHIHMIHNVERPMKEMMLGLENWIPLYMTGQISPYYIKGIHNRIYSHMRYCSGQAAMIGECISGHHDLAHYYLTSKKDEVAFYQKNTAFLFEKASPLMNIYRKEMKDQLYVFLASDAQCKGKRRRILASPPLFAIGENLLSEILDQNHVTVEEKNHVMKNWKMQKEWVENVLSHSIVEDELSEVSEKEYEKYPVVLSLAESFFERDITLSYENYLACINSAEEYASTHDSYQFQVTKVKGFHNIQITCHEGKWCMVSKNKAPAIHFVIYHPKLRYALENLILPIWDE